MLWIPTTVLISPFSLLSVAFMAGYIYPRGTVVAQFPLGETMPGPRRLDSEAIYLDNAIVLFRNALPEISIVNVTLHEL